MTHGTVEGYKSGCCCVDCIVVGTAEGKMKPQKTYAEAVKYALERDAKMTVEDNFTKVVVVMHHDMTYCTFHHAELEEWNGWLIVYTEHNGVHVFLRAPEDLHWRVFRMR